MLLANRVILVTGAGSGIGRGICEALGEEGAAVVATDRDGPAADETARGLTEAGRDALSLAADVTDASRMSVALERAAERLGPVDGLVNNAGVLRMGPALDADPADLAVQFEVNTGALFACCQLVARDLVARGASGSIVNVASNAGKVGYPNMAAYNASKAAVVNLTRTLAAEWAEHGINVNAVCPGGVDTPMLSEVARWVAGRIDADQEALRSEMVPAQLGRHVRPVEVGRVVAFLLSDRATVIRGQALNVDGGDTPY